MLSAEFSAEKRKKYFNLGFTKEGKEPALFFLSFSK